MARSTRFPVAVIGAGALGTLFWRRLSKVVPTALIARTTKQIPEADWVIVLVKGYDTDAAIRTASRMKARGIVSLQNGLIDAIPQGVTTAAAHRVGRRVFPVATGKTLLPPGFEALAAILRRAGFEARVTRDIKSARLQKLLANVCLNPVTAVFRISNGQVLKEPYRRCTEALAREAAPVVGIAAAQALGRVAQVAKATAANRSSMLQDLLAGRRTEIEHLTGALLRLAQHQGVAVPTHRAFYQLIRVMEAG